ncbi:MAG: methylated-DNA--[protein]-cysteine S-methyltransferase, partial [Methanobrevibacter sp.]|nr:methylated-DNA--[protein]-cysteine S-methyltransferase [Methanobrevibacter sp.]
RVFPVEEEEYFQEIIEIEGLSECLNEFKDNKNLKKIIDDSVNGNEVDFSHYFDFDDLNLTNFQKKVLKETFKIPNGEIRTYKEIGEAIGSKAYRAIGNALNKNPLFYIIPCHRVVGTNMKLTGFRSGLELKKEMLLKEGFKIENNRIIIE